MNTLNSNSGQRYHAGERVTDPMKEEGARGVEKEGEEEEKEVTFF